ncbi:hypothetical protein [Bacillus cereus]|uniref:hypothetical protein n=1 Tax=Bacillus cereus TaxID=1396 RepID=UPI0023611632|nr:hypothetical protein [Bacillus cereus]MDD0822787.1 hypothetical protein [Bacillus cereus]
MNNHSENAAQKIREIAMEFMQKNEKKQFQRKDLEMYIDNKFKTTEGSKTGALNRLLLRNEENGIFQVGRGIYLYDSTAEKGEYKVLESVQKIMDDAFEKARNKLKVEVVDYLTEDDIEAICKINEVLKVKEKIDEILKVKS